MMIVTYGVVLEELDVGYDVEHRALMHPVW